MTNISNTAESNVENNVLTAAAPHRAAPRWLKTTFNFVASAGVGAASSFAIKAAAFTLIGSQAVAIGASVVAIGAASAAIQRTKDVYNWNKTHKDDKAGFFDFAKTGHSGKHYLKKGAVSSAFALVGSLLGVAAHNWFDVGPLPQVEPAVGPEIPGLIIPPPAEVPLPVDALTEAKNLIPENACGDMSVVLHRLESTNDLVRAQAIKDLGYYFANGFCGVQENDGLANKLFQMSLDVSHGQNIQAAHDLGYQSLHGLGMAEPDYDRAYELLGKSSAGGHPLSPPMLDYMKVHKLVPQ